MIIFLVLLSPFIWGQQAPCPDDYVMLATFYEMKEYRTFHVSNQGEITYNSKQQFPLKPFLIAIAPNGKWGLIGCVTTPDPSMQYSILLKIGKEKNIELWDYLYNKYLNGETSRYVSISPDSSIGCYGNNLNSVRVLNNNFYNLHYNSNIPVAVYDFLSSNRILAQTGWHILSEFSVSPDGVTTPTGVTIDISPSTAQRGIRVSPDGRTAIVISGVGADVTVIRVNGDGDFSVVQQFGYAGDNYNPSAVYFSQNSSLAAIRYQKFISIYAVSYDSRLTEISRASIPRGVPDGMMAVSYDFKLAVAGYRVLESGVQKSYFYVFRIHENGMIEYMPDKDYVCLGLYGDIAFVPPQVTDAEPAWDMYE